MESVIYCDEVTTSSNADNILKAVARANCLNHADTVDFNKYGIKDNIGLLAVSDVFCDCFILELNNKNEEDQYVHLRSYLNLSHLQKAGITCIDEGKFKISCADYDIVLIMEFLKSLSDTNYKLNAIDITKDFAGSFDKAKVMSHLLDNHGFVEETFISRLYPTILKNRKSPHTCLQVYKNKSVRCKMYFKMAEMLQSHSVRTDVGKRWLEWANKEDERLPKSRDASTNRGLTRTEITYYIDDNEF